MSRARSETYIATRRVLYKPELKPEILAFIQGKQAAHSADIMRAFFPAGDTNQTSRYLRAMESQGLIYSTRRGKYLWWSPAGVEVTDADLAARTPKPIGNPGSRLTEEDRQANRERRARKAREKRQEERAKGPTPAKPGRHAHCAHENTREEQKRCRRARRRAEASAAKKLRATEEKLADEISLAITEEWLTQVEMHCAASAEDVGEFNPMDGIRERQAERRRQSRERIYAKFGPPTEKWDPAKYRGGPTVYQLAYYIHVRMKNDRDHKGWYRFTYEWVKLHYPHLLANYRDLVDDSLELLVIQGRIKRLDIPVKVAVSGV